MPEHLECRSPHVEARILVVRGELDLLTAPQLEDAVECACREGASGIVVDLRGLEFIDSTGLRALAATRELCAAHGSQLFLIRGAHGQVRRVLAITGLDDAALFPELPADEIALLPDPMDDTDPAPA